ncbi:MAG: hypothetical protein AB7Q29_04560 [Vicinamibacterales bacterium]
MMRTLIATTVATIAIVAATSGRAQANTWDSRAFFTFDAPVSVPGATLPPGEYLFRLADPHSGRKTVQVLSADGRTVYAMFFVNSNDRRQEWTEHAQVSLGEAPHGTPRSISAWWNPSELNGRSFMYAPGEASWERQATTPDASKSSN